MKSISASVGVFHSAHRLLELIKYGSSYTRDAVLSLDILAVCPPEQVLHLSQQCGWIEIEPAGKICLTPRGQELLNQSSYWNRLRIQLVDYLEITKPLWLKLVPKGRNETSLFLPDDTKQILLEAELLAENPDGETVAWWDRLAQSSRMQQADKALVTGRQGEEATINYELSRTGKKPLWQSVESNLSGYDILSVVSEEDSTPLRIEVKTSEALLPNAIAHIARNEWLSSINSQPYMFYLWLINTEKPNRLARVTTSFVENHIPIEKNYGKWESIMIPFAELSNSFIEV